MRPATSRALAQLRLALRLGQVPGEKVARFLAMAWRPRVGNAWYKMDVPYDVAQRAERWVLAELAEWPPADLLDVFEDVAKHVGLGVDATRPPRMFVGRERELEVCAAAYLCSFDRRAATEAILVRQPHPCPYAARQFEKWSEHLEARAENSEGVCVL